MIFSKLFKSKPAFAEEVQALYIKIVEQSRNPVFYTDFEVADSVEGRVDMILLHAFVVMRRLKQGEEQTKEFAQSLYDLMFADFDLNLRELGVGDMGLARRVPKMAEAFYGRITVYEDGLGAEDEDVQLKEALDRNLYRKTPVSDESLQVMAQYLRREAKNLEETDIAALLKGELTFGKPPAGKATS
ncbi:ubiquinol-cytochrome C chaperone family protein [Terasakiella sp. A23]|uniref:ubiquinol-cytochrome C chaperone family protein n=1 Tax=Terasakiella sp. FCG-A23 TaxID=3080561 RepID=UPI0029535951|nr:ubiquinol-cytochrome C chaperone family protein [Terasakiella sp. A23]MDV7338648.1 ubiquinol-cytochrome C chaperone family protein [Terasakiella sp. A23]